MTRQVRVVLVKIDIVLVVVMVVDAVVKVVVVLLVAVKGDIEVVDEVTFIVEVVETIPSEVLVVLFDTSVVTCDGEIVISGLVVGFASLELVVVGLLINKPLSVTSINVPGMEDEDDVVFVRLLNKSSLITSRDSVPVVVFKGTMSVTLTVVNTVEYSVNVIVYS